MRLSALVLAAACLLPPVAPAWAGPSETAFLAQLPGTWKGTGTVTGVEGGAVTCTLTLKGKDKINFAGTCNAAKFPPQNYTGVLTYSDAAKQYQARANGEVVIGTKSGNGVAFNFKMKTVAGTGATAMKLTPTSIIIDVDIVRSDTGEKLKSHVTFARA